MKSLLERKEIWHQRGIRHRGISVSLPLLGFIITREQGRVEEGESLLQSFVQRTLLH